MKFFILLFPVLVGACSINRAPSLNMLDKRADFNGMNEVEEALQAVDNPLLVPVRTEPLVADIWVHPHELSNGDYFRGAWIRTVVSRSSWRMDDKQQPLLIKDDGKSQAQNTKTRGTP